MSIETTTSRLVKKTEVEKSRWTVPLMMSAQLRPRILRIFPFFREAVFCSVKQAISHFLFLRNLFFKWIPYSPSLSHVSDFAIFY
jgi:hypothetical protein